MKKQDLAKAIKSVLAENTKKKLDESKIRQAIREVLAEEGKTITLTLSVGEASAILDGLASSNLENNISKAGDMQGAGGRILANLNHAKAKLQNALNGDRGEDLNEEVYDLVRDVKAALSNNNPSQEDVEAYLKRKLYDEEKEAFGFIKRGGNSQGGKKKRVIGYKHGQPVYAWVWE